MEAYCRHALQQLHDRHADAARTDASAQCSMMLHSGALLMALSHQYLVMLYRMDGMDQAKLRVPRVLVKSHARHALIRPALHVQG